MDPSSPGDLQTLREAIRHSQSELEPFRQQYRERLVQYAGDEYGDNRDAVDSPFNVYNLALRIYKRRLFSGQMRVLVTSRSPSERRAAWELGLAGDDVIREIKLDATFDKVLQQALLSVGIVKIGLVAEGTAESDDVCASYNHGSHELHEWDVQIRAIRVIRGCDWLCLECVWVIGWGMKGRRDARTLNIR